MHQVVHLNALLVCHVLHPIGHAGTLSFMSAVETVPAASCVCVQLRGEAMSGSATRAPIGNVDTFVTQTSCFAYNARLTRTGGTSRQPDSIGS